MCWSSVSFKCYFRCFKAFLLFRSITTCSPESYLVGILFLFCILQVGTFVGSLSQNGSVRVDSLVDVIGDKIGDGTSSPRPLMCTKWCRQTTDGKHDVNSTEFNAQQFFCLSTTSPTDSVLFQKSGTFGNQGVQQSVSILIGHGECPCSNQFLHGPTMCFFSLKNFPLRHALE